MIRLFIFSLCFCFSFSTQANQHLITAAKKNIIAYSDMTDVDFPVKNSASSPATFEVFVNEKSVGKILLEPNEVFVIPLKIKTPVGSFHKKVCTLTLEGTYHIKVCSVLKIQR